MNRTQKFSTACAAGMFALFSASSSYAQVPDAFKHALDRTTLLVSAASPYCIDFQYSQTEPRATSARACSPNGNSVASVRLRPDRAAGADRTGRMALGVGPSGMYERCVATSGDSVVVGFCLGAAEERWTWGDGRLVDAQGRCLTLAGTEGEAVAVTMRTCDGSDLQRWYRVAFLFTPRAENTGSLPVPGPVVPYDIATEVALMGPATHWPEFSLKPGVPPRTIVSVIRVGGSHANLEQEGYALTWPQ